MIEHLIFYRAIFKLTKSKYTDNHQIVSMKKNNTNVPSLCVTYTRKNGNQSFGTQSFKFSVANKLVMGPNEM